MPIAITPPAVQVKDLESTLNSLPETRRKIICFSGKSLVASPSDTCLSVDGTVANKSAPNRL